jgi:cytochrome c oxidase assembly protein Cox11
MRSKGVVDGQRVNIPVLFFIDNEGRRRLSEPGVGFWFKRIR